MKFILTLVACAAAASLFAFNNYKEAYQDGIKKYRSKNYSAAITSMEEALKFAKKDSEKFDANRIIITASFYSANKEKGLQAARNIDKLKYSVADGEIYDYWYGSFLNRIGRQDEALKTFGNVRNRNAKTWAYSNALYSAADICIQRKKYPEAIAYCEDILKLPKGNSEDIKFEARKVIGNCYAYMKQYDKAVQMYQTIQLTGPAKGSQASYYYGYASALTGAKQYKKAVEQLDTAAKLPNLSKNHEAYIHTMKASICFYHLKDIPEAKKAIDRSNAVQGAAWGKDAGLTKQINAAVAKSTSK